MWKAPGKITSVGVTGGTGNRPLNVFDGATLVVRNLELETEQNNGGSVIFSEGGNIDIEKVTINCHHFGHWSQRRFSCSQGLRHQQ